MCYYHWNISALFLFQVAFPQKGERLERQICQILQEDGTSAASESGVLRFAVSYALFIAGTKQLW